VSGARRRILKNLEGRIHPMNEMCTISGIEFIEGREELLVMLRKGLVELHYFLGMPMYKLSYLGRDMIGSKLRLVVDNDKAG